MGLLVERVWLALCLTGITVGQVTSRMSVNSIGLQGNDSSFNASISADGRYVVFQSFASNLVHGDTNGTSDIFVRDRLNGTTERVSVDSAGTQGNDGSLSPSISADGRYVAFASHATNFVNGDTNGEPDVFVHDRQSSTTEIVSVDSAGAQGNNFSGFPSISADGRYVAFLSNATNLVPGGTNGWDQIFVHDRVSGTTEIVSVDSSGIQGNDTSGDGLSISADGRYVAFQSHATNLVPGDTNGTWDVFVHDRQSGTTVRVSVDSAGVQGNSVSEYPSISADGRYVTFTSLATNLVPGDTNGSSDIFLHDMQTGTTERVSVDSVGTQGNNHSAFSSISVDDRYVAFGSLASNLVPGDTNGCEDVFVRDLQNGTTERISFSSSGTQGNAYSDSPWISADGRYVAFESDATNLVPGDTNANRDIFVHDRTYSPFTSFCNPGVASVIACPCSNPPSALGRGCDNSAGTGGATLSASGIAYLSMDTLVFTTSGETSTAMSIVLQGDALAVGGFVFGQGVVCGGGNLLRLYMKDAVAGSITAPQSEDRSVSSRAATLGDTIPPGQSRWYFVYYRDLMVLGGCPATSTFNATQTGRVFWIP
jgi:Tol biopolymer transport system component